MLDLSGSLREVSEYIMDTQLLCFLISALIINHLQIQISPRQALNLNFNNILAFKLLTTSPLESKMAKKCEHSGCTKEAVADTAYCSDRMSHNLPLS